VSGVRVGDYVASAATSALAYRAGDPPWDWTGDAEAIVRDLIAACGSDYDVRDGVAVHISARVETGAALKAPAFIGPDCFIASTALVRGGCWLERACLIGPGAELKTSFMFAGSKLAHLNFVGDSVLGQGVNIEAGAMIANYRNECDDKRIRIRVDGHTHDTGVDKFGALVGDQARIGANAVIAPGAIVPPRTIVARLSLIDQG
jgi:NDP-sugar pyrophosphorylase family protein